MVHLPLVRDAGGAPVCGALHPRVWCRHDVAEGAAASVALPATAATAAATAAIAATLAATAAAAAVAATSIAVAAAAVALAAEAFLRDAG